MDWLEEGMYVIVTPVGQNDYEAVVYSKVYRRIAEYFCVNPDEREDNDSWLLIKRVHGENVILKANPFSPVIGCIHVKPIYMEI
jgi:hypothetical protein